MYLVILILSILVSGWFVWRRSPRYSAKRTAWTLAAMLAIGLVVGLIPLWLIPSLPAEAQSAAILAYGSFVLLVTLVACAVILRVTDGPMAKPRPTATVVKVHRRKVGRIAKAIGVGVLLLAACDLVIPGAYRGIASTMAGLLAFCAVPAIYGLHHNASRYDRAATALNDNPWTVWRSSAAAAEVRLGPEGLLVGDEY